MTKNSHEVVKNAGYFVLFLGVTCLVFFNSFSAGFVGDDLAVIPNNYKNLGDPSKIISYFSHGVWYHTNEGLAGQSIYRPLWLVWEFLIYQVASENPSIWHVSNLMLHSLNGLMLLFLAKFLYPASSQQARCALVVIFLIYPVVSHNVIWVSGSTDLLLTFFCLSSLTSYFRYCEDGRNLWFYTALFFYVCAISTKEMGLTLLPLLVLIDLHCRVNFKKRIIDYLIIAIVVLGYFGLRAFALGRIAGAVSGWQVNAEALWRFFEYGSVYLRTLFFPWPLTVTVRHLPVGPSSFADPYLGILLLILLGWLVIKFPRLRLGVGIIIVPMTIPVLLALNSYGVFATRFLYFSTAGLALLCAPIFTEYLMRRKFRVLYFLALAVLSVVTIFETYAWKNQGVFSSKLISYDDDSANLWISMAGYYADDDQILKSISIYHKAVSELSSDKERNKVTLALAGLYAGNKEFDLSIVEYRKVQSAPGFEHLGWTGIGNSLWMLGHLDEASYAYAQAINAKPDHFFALYNYGLINAQLRQFTAAIEVYETLRRLPPGVGTASQREQVEINLHRWRLTELSD